MKSELAVAAIVCAAVLSVASLKLRAENRTSSVWDGVYTKAQADRGQALYNSSCASCHGDQLNGGETAPPLAGGEFISSWDGLTVGELFDRIRTGMPPGTPGTVTRNAKIDILAYVLSYNKFPPGDRELPHQVDMMNTIRIEADNPNK
jgi:S-disulfanyl-L-cysteine oxidoreductase SoxD